MTNSINRRDFFKLSGGVAAIAATATIAPNVFAGWNTLGSPKVNSSKRIHVTSEYGTLREVIVGRAPEPTDKYFTWKDGYEKNMATWLKPETVALLKANKNKTWIEVYGEEGYNKFKSQLDNFAQVLEDNGVKVIRPAPIAGKNLEYIDDAVDQAWPRDCFCTVGNSAVVSSLRMPFKRKQQFGFTKLYKDIVKSGQGKFLSAPQASLDIFTDNVEALAQANDDSICLDGGDFFVDSNNIYLGIGKGSNMNGYEWVKSMFGDEYTVTPIILDKKSLHLDCALSILSPNLALICRDWIKSELPESLKHYDFIEVSAEEAAWLGCNGLPISPDTCIMDQAHKRVIAEVRKRGHKVIEVDYSMPSMLGGALRCSTQPIYRDPV